MGGTSQQHFNNLKTTFKFKLWLANHDFQEISLEHSYCNIIQLLLITAAWILGKLPEAWPWQMAGEADEAKIWIQDMTMEARITVTAGEAITYIPPLSC